MGKDGILWTQFHFWAKHFFGIDSVQGANRQDYKLERTEIFNVSTTQCQGRRGNSNCWLVVTRTTILLLLFSHETFLYHSKDEALTTKRTFLQSLFLMIFNIFCFKEPKCKEGAGGHREPCILKNTTDLKGIWFLQHISSSILEVDSWTKNNLNSQC